MKLYMRIWRRGIGKSGGMGKKIWEMGMGQNTWKRGHVSECIGRCPGIIHGKGYNTSCVSWWEGTTARTIIFLANLLCSKNYSRCLSIWYAKKVSTLCRALR